MWWQCSRRPELKDAGMSNFIMHQANLNDLELCHDLLYTLLELSTLECRTRISHVGEDLPSWSSTGGIHKISGPSMLPNELWFGYPGAQSCLVVSSVSKVGFG